ncbi:hypothetical protein LIER_21127 [Lithospermum erythrorhizon]|uniref:Protein SirB1 N-terminal domain-containing protein n=1 Tax=Lithospermum erythrorhizon TaxID=34254 RepID=A0AAV3QRW7_LITER
MNSLTCSWIYGSFSFLQNSRNCPSSSSFALCSKQDLLTSDFKFVLHDTLHSSGFNTTHVRFKDYCFVIENQRSGWSLIVRKQGLVSASISKNRGVDLGRAALYIAAEDDSLVTHSSVALPVEDFVKRLHYLSMDYCSLYSSSFSNSPESFLKCLERYLYIDKGFRRTSTGNILEHRALYLNSVLTHRSGSASLLCLIYSEILKMLRLLGLMEFDVELFLPHDHHSPPHAYLKQNQKEANNSPIMTPESLLVEMLRDLKNAFWPFQGDHGRSPFLRAAQAANYSDNCRNTEESGWELASAKAAQHRLQRGVWTSVLFGDMRRALSACERLILLDTDPKALRDYSILLYHCGFYKDSLDYLKAYQEAERMLGKERSSQTLHDLEGDAVDKILTRLNLILMEEGWSRPEDNRNVLFNNSDPW